MDGKEKQQNTQLLQKPGHRLIQERIEIETREENERRRTLAWQKLQTDQQRIAAMVLSSAGRKSLPILPEEMWCKIADYLSENINKWHFRNACGTFYKVVDQSPGQLLFLVVLPDVFKWLDRLHVLRCRQVCKNWHHAVNKLVEHLENSGNSKQLNKYCLWHTFTLANFSTTTNNAIQTAMSQHARNPLIGKAVRFRLHQNPHPITYQEFHQELETLLKALGEHMHYVRFCAKGMICTGGAVESLWSDIITLCPNLKTLSVENFTSINMNGQYVHIPPCTYPEHKQIKSYVAQDNNSALVLETNFIEKYSNQLKQVRLHHHWRNGYYLLKWNCLESLDLRASYLVRFSSLESVAAPKLKALSINVQESNVCLSDIMRVVHNFPCLTVLRLSFESDNVLVAFSSDQVSRLVGGGNVCCFSLTKLELGLSILEPRPCIDLILLFPSLKTLKLLHMKWSSFRPPKDMGKSLPHILDLLSSFNKDLPRFPQCNCKIYESNLWTLLPRLKQLYLVDANPFKREVVKTRVYSREWFELQKGNREKPEQDKLVGDDILKEVVT